MASVAIALKFVFPMEGGFVNDPLDHGGATNMGITQATLDLARKKRPKAKYPAKVQDLTHEQAVDIYECDFAPPHFAEIVDQRVGTVLFDMGVNAGPRQSVTLMQRALCALGASVAVDGDLGPATLAAINAQEPDHLLGAFTQQRVAFYQHIVDREPSQARFLKGWLRRARTMPEAV